MKIEIKNLKYAAFNSEETLCFQCTVYIDGKRVIRASNGGYGGPNEYHPFDRSMKHTEMYDLIKKAETELGKQTYTAFGKKFKHDFDLEIDKLVQRELKNREIKRDLKRIAYFDGKGILLCDKNIKPTATNLRLVQQAPWWKPGNILLNKLDIDAVRQIYNQYVYNEVEQ